jgi:5-methylcytosine-specific restriction endonuclease McrA
MAAILRLDLAGTPTAWLSREMAATAYVKGLVRWELGKKKIILHGGINRLGEQSLLALSPVIATVGEIVATRGRTARSCTNRMLFRRDNYHCMYCGHKFHERSLTRDHVVPRSKGGGDNWENVVAACQRCNHHKADRTPEQAGMKLLAVPFRPNTFEAMYLAQHTVLADQMDYLEKQFSGMRDWQAA